MNELVFAVSVLGLIGIYATITLSLDLQFSYGNLVNLGIVAYVAAGAYAYAIVTQGPPGEYDNYKYGFGLPIIVGLIAAGLAGLVLGAITAWPSLRMRGEYLALITFAFAEIFNSFLQNTTSLTNGLIGLPSVVTLFDNMSPALQTELFAAVTVGLAFVTYLVVRRLTTSPFGRVLLAISDDEQGAAAVGKNVGRLRLQTFLIGSFISGLAGAFFVMYVSIASPTIFVPDVTFIIWIALVLGGVRTRFGALIGAAVLIGAQEGVRLLSLSPDQAGTVSALRLLVTGLLLVVLLRVRPPEHLLGTSTRWARRNRRRDVVAKPQEMAKELAQ